jgi:membrane-associated phospholipid phosphatase
LIALPLFVTRENKYKAGWTMFLSAALLYVLSNKFHLFPPQELPMTSWDLAVPFIPETYWIYVSEYLLFTAVYMTSSDYRNMNKYLYSFFALQTFSVLIFWLWPTTFPRHLFPIPAETDPITTFAFEALRKADSPSSCFPSLHVSSVLLSTYIFRDEQREKFKYFLLWGLLIAASTITTKQHYLMDVAGGLVLSVFFYWLFHRVIPYRDITKRGDSKPPQTASGAEMSAASEGPI